ncbi:hypothetical protein EJB05_49552, partial [Eragrostis curvula]
MSDISVALRQREREAGGPGKNDMQEGSVLSHDALRVLLSDLYGAGASTTAALIEWGMVDLIQNPEVVQKVRDELTTVLGEKPPIEESIIARLPYLQAVVKEILSSADGGALVPRKAEADIKSSEAWDDADKFMPERFIGGETRSYIGQDFGVIPFGLGRRICPGMPLVQKLIPLILGTLLHRFEWTLPAKAKVTGIDMTERCGVVLSPVNPLQAIPKEI